jgi:hypothetical protein
LRQILFASFSLVLPGKGRRSVGWRLVNFPYPANSNASEFATWFLEFDGYEARKQNEGGS